MTSTILHLTPGERVTVQLVADGAGNVAEPGDVLELVGEVPGYPQAAVAEAAGTGVVLLDRYPEDYDENAAYGANEVVGETMAYLTDPVHWAKPSDGFAAGPGDLVVADAGGTVRAYDSVGGDTPDQVFGRVWMTNPAGTEGAANKVAVVRD